MRLSEAMMLGSTTCKMEAGNWNSCALGAAGNAIGIPQARVFESLFGALEYSMADGCNRIYHIYSAWPWLFTSTRADEIWRGFDFRVCTGEMTFEQLVDYVRSIEPSCGDCNVYECTCVQKMDSVPTAVETFV